MPVLLRLTEALGPSFSFLTPSFASRRQWRRTRWCAPSHGLTSTALAGQPWEGTGSLPGRGLASLPGLDGHSVRSGAEDPDTPRVRIRNGQAATPGSGGGIVPICSGCFLFLSAGSAALTRWVYPVVYGARQGFLFLLSQSPPLDHDLLLLPAHPHPSFLSSTTFKTHTHAHTHTHTHTQGPSPYATL